MCVEQSLISSPEAYTTTIRPGSINHSYVCTWAHDRDYDATIKLPQQSGTLALVSDLAAKQDALVSGENIKTVEGQSLLGSGNIELTKTDVGLGNVDNTSDLNKPISTATQTALNAKQDALISGTNIKTVEGQSLLGSGNIDITKSDVGLGSVDNTSDLNKPISTATQNALNKKSSRMSIYGSLPTDTSTPVSIELTEDERILIGSGAIDLLLVHDDGKGLTYAFKKMLDYPEEGDYSFYYHKHFGTTSDDRYIAELETGTFEIRKIDSAHDSSKQDTLVSGTNIKTINGQSLLGSGDIALNVVYFEPDA